MSKRVVISGYYGFKNFGDEAILSFLVENLKNSAGKITVITADPDYTNSIHCVDCVKTFDFKSIIKTIKSSDVLISGGGSLLQDATSIKSLIYYLLIIKIAQFFKKKVIVFAQGIGPIKSILGQILTRIILKKCNNISVRDYKSHELLKTWGINSDIVSDPVFSLPIEVKQKEKVIGVQLRNCRGMNDDFLKRLAKSVYEEFQGHKIKLLSLQDTIDLDICEKFKQILIEYDNNLDINIYSKLNHNDVIEEINSCEYLIAMRFHAIIIGLLAGVKTLAINYDVKVEKLALEFELPIFDMNNEFSNQFNMLKAKDLSVCKQKLQNKKFDINKFLFVINN